MKLILLLIVAMLFRVSMMAQPVRVMTYNIRYNNPDDGENAWPVRKAEVAALIRFHEADLFGLQEALIGQIEDLQQQLPEMKWIGVGRDDGKQAGEFSPLFYNATKFNLLQKGWFWLSETPEEPALGWDAACIRICTWGLFEVKETGKKFCFFNTHFDHRGDKARVESAKLILKEIQKKNPEGLPVILTGDFNLTPETEPIKLISAQLNDAKFSSKEAPYGPEGTFNGFNFNSPLDERIDYIFVKGPVSVEKFGVLTDSKNQRYPSDHLPVFAKLLLK